MLDIKLIDREIREAPSEARLNVLLERSMSAYRTHPKEALRWAEKALKLAEKLGRPLDAARAIYRIGCAQVQLAQFDVARASLTHSFERLTAIEEGARFIDAPQFMLAELDRKQGKVKEALQRYDEIIQLRRTYGKNNVWEARVAKGIALQQSGDLAAALASYYEALDTIDEETNLLARSVILSDVGTIFLEINDLQRAESYLQKSAALQREIGDEPGLASTLNNLATTAKQRGDYETALNYARQTIALRNNPACGPRAAFAAGVLGEIELARKDYAAAIDHYSQALGQSVTLGLDGLAAEARVGLATCMMHQGSRTKKVIDLLRTALDFSTLHGQKLLQGRALELLALAYQQRHDFEASSRYFADHVALRRELDDQEQLRSIVEVQARVEIDRIEKERKRLGEIAASALERASLLESERERQTSELTALALQLIQKNEFISDLRERLQAGAAKDAEPLIREIDDHVRNDRDWEAFQNQLSYTHGDFLKRLSAAFPQLTPMELRTCALLKLEFSTKAIASLLCVSPRTVENHRLNIRKKCGLHAEENLGTFVASI